MQLIALQPSDQPRIGGDVAEFDEEAVGIVFDSAAVFPEHDAALSMGETGNLYII